MSLRRILVLLGLVAALFVYLSVYELPQARKEGHREKLLPLDKESVTAVNLVYPDREIDVRKDGGNWRVVKPLDAPADESVVKSVVSTIADAEVQKTLDEMPQDLGGFGLDKPSVTVRVTLKDGSQPPPLAIGKNTAIGGKTYVRKGDEPKLYLTTSSLQFGLNKQVKDLRDKQLIAFQDDDVTRVDIAPAGAETVSLLRRDKEAWTVDPGGYAADVTEVRSYLSSLRSTRATDFPDEAPTDLGKYGLDRPRLTVTVATGKEGSETKSLLLGSESTQDTQKQVYAKRADQPTVYALGDWSFRTLSKTAAQFRDKTVLGFDPARVGRVALERKDGAGVTVARADGGWRLEKGEGKTPKGEAIDRFLDDLRDLRGSDIAAEPARDVAPYGLNAPDLRITLTDKEGQAMGTVLAAKHEGKYYVMHAGAETVFEARDYMYTRLDKQPWDLVEGDASATTTTQPPPPPPAEEDEEDEQDEEPAPDDDAD